MIHIAILEGAWDDTVLETLAKDIKGLYEYGNCSWYDIQLVTGDDGVVYYVHPCEASLEEIYMTINDEYKDNNLTQEIAEIFSRRQEAEELVWEIIWTLEDEPNHDVSSLI